MIQIHARLVGTITETAAERGAEARSDLAGEELGVSFLEQSSQY